MSSKVKSAKRTAPRESQGEHQTASGCGEQSAEKWATRAEAACVKPTIDATTLLGVADSDEQPILRGERVRLRGSVMRGAWKLRDTVWRHTNPRARLTPVWVWSVIESGLASVVIEHSSPVQRWEDDDAYTLQVRCPTWALELVTVRGGGGSSEGAGSPLVPATDLDFRLRRVRALRAKRRGDD